MEVVNEHGDWGAGASFAQADVVQAAVVADGDGASGVDFVVADAVVRGDFLAGGEGSREKYDTDENKQIILKQGVLRVTEIGKVFHRIVITAESVKALLAAEAQGEPHK